MMRARAEERAVAARPRAQQLAARDYQEVVNFSFVDAAWERGSCRQREPDPPAQSDRQPAGRHAHRRWSAAWSPTCATTSTARSSRVRVFEIGRVFAARPEREGWRRSTSPASASRRASARIAYGPALEEQWGVRRPRPVDFFDVKGDVEALLAPRRARFVQAAHPALHPGRVARIDAGRQARSAGWANCIRAGSRNTSCRGRRCCSNSTASRSWPLPLARLSARSRSSRR